MQKSDCDYQVGLIHPMLMKINDIHAFESCALSVPLTSGTDIGLR